MPITICIQCALEAFVRGADQNEMKTASRFDEEPEAHRLRLHPDLKATQIRRQELLELAATRMGGSLIIPICPKCGYDDAKVFDTTQALSGIVRVRCSRCGHEFPTTTLSSRKM